MSDTNETHADVIAEMRECAEAAYPAIWNDERIAGLVEKEKRQQLDYCRRLEAALKREKGTAEKSSAVGDCAKMREAMRLVSRVAVQMTRGTITGEAPTRKEVDDWAMRLCDIIGAALSAPPRNCVKIPMEVKHDNRKIR